MAVIARSNEELKYLISEVKKGKLKLDEIDVSEVQDFSWVFAYFTFDPKYGSIENWDVSNGINFESMFLEAKKTSLLNLSKWRLSNAKDCDSMFADCEDFIGGDLSNWNPINLKSAEGMFSWCENFIGKGLDKWHLPNLESSIGMFEDCKNFDQDLSNWDCRNLKLLNGMFKGCTKFRGGGLEKWNITLTSKGLPGEVNALNEVFEDCINFDADLSSWKVEGPFYLNSTFRNCKNFKGKGLEKWKITALGTKENHFLEYTFYECSKLDFSKSPDWKFGKLRKTFFPPFYYSTFTNNASLTTAKFLSSDIIIYPHLVPYSYNKSKSPSKPVIGFHSIEDLPDNITFSVEGKTLNKLKLWLGFPNLKKPTPINIHIHEKIFSLIPSSSESETTIPFKVASKRIRLKRIDEDLLKSFKKEYGPHKNSIPLNVKYGSGPFGYPLAKKTEMILPKIFYYKLIQKIPIYEDNKIQAPNTVLAEIQGKSFSEKLFFNTKNIFFNKDYIKCF